VYWTSICWHSQHYLRISAMSVNKNGNLRPDGISFALPFFGLGGTYYWNPGSPTAPRVTLSGGLGMGGGGVHLTHLRKGMTSQDSLGYGAAANISTIFPSVTVNASIPDDHGIPEPWNAKVSSIETGAGLPGFGVTYTSTPEQIGEAINRYIFGPAMGPQDELSPLERSLREGAATVGPANEPPTRFLRSRPAHVLGDGMDGWSARYIEGNAIDGRADAANSGAATGPAFSGRMPAAPYVPQPPQGTPGGIPGLIAAATGSASSDPSQFQLPAGGLLGMIQEYMRNNPAESGGR
jgi:hypothetical protein